MATYRRSIPSVTMQNKPTEIVITADSDGKERYIEIDGEGLCYFRAKHDSPLWEALRAASGVGEEE